MRTALTAEHRENLRIAMRESHRRRREGGSGKRVRANRVKPKTSGEVHEDYLEQVEKFHQWCQVRDLNYRTEVAAMLNQRMKSK